MLRAFSVGQVRRAEAALMAVLPDGALMQRAAVGLAAECVRLLGGHVYGARVIAVVGSGDNGGDALYAAAWLGRRGAAVEAVLLDAERAHAGGVAAVRSVGGRVSAGEGWRFSGAELVLDGVTGIGGQGGLRPVAAAVFEQVDAARAGIGSAALVEQVDAARAASSARGSAKQADVARADSSGSGSAAIRAGGPIVVAVDVPSGVDSDTGEVSGAAVRADVTVTFGAYKPGLLISPGAEQAGERRFVDIGLGPYLEGEPVLEALERADVAALRPVPATETNKYRRGVVGVVAGSVRYPGAAVLATGAALRSGAGAVRFVGGPEVSAGVLARYPETLISAGRPKEAGRVQSWVVGPGLGNGPEAAERVAAVLAEDVPVLVDADGLTHVQDLDRAAPTILTPHAGEAARLLGEPWTAAEVEARRLAAVRELAERHGCTVLLKGSTTLVAEPGRTTIRVNLTGTPALATAGSGDVLSGLTGGLLAVGLSAYDAASVGAWLHGEAGMEAARATRGSIIAGDLVDAIG